MSRITPANFTNEPKKNSTVSTEAKAKIDEPIFHYGEESSAQPPARARTIAICLALFVSAIAISQFGQPSRARQAEFLRGAAKVDALGKPRVPDALSSTAAVNKAPANKASVTRNAEAKELTPAVYVSHKYGVAWQYPRTYVLRRGANASLNLSGQTAVPSTFVQPGGLALATVIIPSKLYPGTDFKSAALTVRVNPRISSEECSGFRNPEDETATLQPAKVTVGTIDFDEADHTTDSNDGGDTARRNQEKYYHVYENEACYEFAMKLNTASAATASPRVPVDADEVFDRLSEVLTSVTIVPVRNPTSAAVVRGE
jgi:hypothetical protein